MDNLYLDRLAVAMKNKNISEAALTKELGISISTFTDWRKGKARPALETLVKIADYLELSLDWIVFGEQKNTPHLPSLEEDSFLIECANLNKTQRMKVQAYITGLKER